MSLTRFQERIARAQAIMVAKEIDLLLISPGSNFFYFTNHDAHSSERTYLLIVPKSGKPRLVLPALEKLGAEEKLGSGCDYFAWSDAEGSSGILAAALPEAHRVHNLAGDGIDVTSWKDGKRMSTAPMLLKVAVDNQMWSGHLLDVQTLLGHTEWIKGTEVIKPLRIAKSSDEIAIMKQAAAIADKTLAELTTQKFSGRTELEIASEIQRLLLANGQQAMQFCIVGSGPNGAMPHHGASDRVIQPGDAIVLDFGGTYNGYQSDMTRIAAVRGGTIDPEFEKVFETVDAANRAAHAAARPGVSCESVDKAARDVIIAAGYGEYFTHRTGHGLGIDVHEDPYIVSGNTEVLELGMAFSIEPGVYLPGRFGVRMEDIAIVTESGAENINLSPHPVYWVD